MDFEPMSAEQYRALTTDELINRRDLIANLLEGDAEVDMEQLRSEIGIIEAEYERRNAAIQLRNANIAAVAGGAGNVFARSADSRENIENVDALDTPEYRNAFMEYVCRGAQMPEQFRTVGTNAVTINGEYTQTTDVPPQVPTTMAREIISKMETYGQIWSKVRKLSVKGGLWFRVVDLTAEATWIDETKTSGYQKVTNNDKVSFSFFMLECRISQSLLAGAVTFDDFQAMFTPIIAKAMVKALEQAIMRGDGTSQPLGILNDTRVTTKGTVIEVTEAQFKDWRKWHSDIWAKVPTAYRDGEWTMAQSTWDTYIATMADNNNAPVSVGYNPVTGDEIKRIIGRGVSCVESDILPDFDAASAGDVVAIFGNWNDYAVNVQPGMPLTTKRWIDDDNNLEKTKCLVALDGKVLDPYGFVLLKKKASA